MNHYQHIARRVFNRPHLIEPHYARAFVGALTDRLNIRSVTLPDGRSLDAGEMRKSAEAYDRPERRIFEAVEGVAVIPIEGTLVHRFGHLNPFSGMTGYDGIQAKLEAALDDPSIRGILLDIDSPGGEVAGCFDLTDLIYESRSLKPIWAVADEMACSAAFSLASAAERIITPRTADVGSVGVLTMHADYSQMLEGAGVDVTFIFAGEHKVDGNPYEPLPADVRADIQAEIDQVYDLFTATVARNRGMTQQAVRDTEARIYSGLNAGAVQFTDQVMAAHEVMPAFIDHLTRKEGSAMSLSLFGRRRKAEADEDERLDEEQAETTSETPEPEPDTVEPETAEGAEGDEEQELDKAASAEAIVTLCTEAKVPQLAHGMIQARVTADQAKARIEDAGAIRDACAAAGYPHLADKALAAIESQQFAGFVRSLLTDMTADASGDEVDHKQPQGDAGRAPFNALSYYQRGKQ